ncbi:unnamed protein product [Oreochromis niloticus]|nr:unnamed protein product [Mustela putorius furo]
MNKLASEQTDLQIFWSQRSFTPISSTRLTVSPSSSQFFKGDFVSLSCEEDDSSAGWTLRRNTSKQQRTQCGDGWGKPAESSCNNNVFLSDSGVYWCESREGPISNMVNLTVTGGSVILQSPVLPVMEGDDITLLCKTKTTPSNLPAAFYKDGSLIRKQPTGHMTIQHVSRSDEGLYKCDISGHGESPSSWITVTVLASLFSGNAQVKYLFETPTAIVRPTRYEIPLAGSVTLSCSVDGSDNWTILWYRGETYGSIDEPMTEYEGKKAINVSQSGIYRCRGRSDSGRLTSKSDDAIIKDTLPITAIITMKPNWTQIYLGESFTVRCEIPGGEGTYWSYDWRPERFTTYYTTNERTFYNAGSSENGDYQCRGNKGLSLTQWSNVIPLTISYKLNPVLTVSPSWLSPGASVTLSCEVEYPSEGWLFSWYKAVPYYKITEEPYTYELLPDGSKTAQSFYIINGQTSTAGYVCRVERGSNFYHDYYSKPKFVWSADFYSGPIMVIPDDPVKTGTFVSLSCNLRRRKIFPSVAFYHNNKLIQNDSREELNFLAVSNSDEGSYKCQYSGKESPSRYMSVKSAAGPESSSFPVTARMKVMNAVAFILLMLLSMNQ